MDQRATVIHYHGTPITPRAALHQLAGHHFCVSYAAPGDAQTCHDIGQSVMLDNGAFSTWKRGEPLDADGFYRWAEPWLGYRTTWAVIPDVIDGDPEANDALIAQWPHGTRGAPVWHLHEPISRLCKLAETWPRVCCGSSAQYADVGSVIWHERMTQAMNELCGDGPPPVWLHMMRDMRCSGWIYPFSSVDSTDVARNHHLASKDVKKMATRWDAMQCPARWHKRPVQDVMRELVVA